MTVEVVVAKFNEDVSWTKKLKYNVTIYNKNESENHLFDVNQVDIQHKNIKINWEWI